MCFAREPEDIDQIQIVLKELHPTAHARSLDSFVQNPSMIQALRDKRGKTREVLNATIGSHKDVRKSLGSRGEEDEEMQQLVNTRAEEMRASFGSEYIQFANDSSILSIPKEIVDKVINIRTNNLSKEAVANIPLDCKCRRVNKSAKALSSRVPQELCKLIIAIELVVYLSRSFGIQTDFLANTKIGCRSGADSGSISPQCCTA